MLDVFDENDNILQESAIGNRILFQGREYDWDTGFYYFRARWYDPDTGRWLSKDPIGISGGLNQYVFCGNNPVMFVDPFGLVFKWGEGGWSLVGTVAGIAGGSIVLAATSPAWVTAGAIIGIGGGIIGVIDAWTGADKATKIPQRAVDKWTKPSRSGAPTAGGLYKDSDGDGMPDAIDDTPYPPKKKRGE